MLNLFCKHQERPKVKIVAVAKDESAYFAEWVHHHLYFGFDAIEIYVNRTTDNSAEILDAIKNKYPQVSWQCADWIDICPQDARQNIQFIAYAHAMQNIRASGKFTHVFFLDIDEFWCPENYRDSIQDVIEPLGRHNAIFFEWLNDTGELPCFSSIPDVLSGILSPLGKTLLPIECNVHELRHHVPLFENKDIHILADGQKFKARANPVQALDKSLNSIKSSFIYHRAHRSEVEYVSLLYRGRPGNQFKYKNNRSGIPKCHRATLNIDLPMADYQTYQTSRQSFISKIDIITLQKRAEAFVLERYENSLANLSSTLETHYTEMKKIFSRVSINEVVSKFKDYRQSKIEVDRNNIGLIREFAVDAVWQDIDEAIELMEIAHQLRPKGPYIKRKLQEFKEIKAKRGGR
jgi:hypothetical protein